MSTTKNITIVGNCQAQSLEGIFIVGEPSFTVERLPPVFMMTDNHKNRVLELFDRADHIFLQRVDSNYALEWVRPDWVRSTFGKKVVVWPNLYFDGYFPDVQYIYTSPYGKLQGPLDDYHLMSIFESHKAGRSLDMAYRAMNERDPLEDRSAFRLSLNNLVEREKDVDVIMSDYLSDEVVKRRAFYTPNHPYNFVLIEMAERLAKYSGFKLDLKNNCICSTRSEHGQA